MKNKRSVAIIGAPPQPEVPARPAALKFQPAPIRTGWLRAWQDFWFSPVHPVGLHSLRVLAGLLFLSWLLPFAGNIEALFGLEGWLDRQAIVEASRLGTPLPMPLNWSLLYVVGEDVTLLNGIYWAAIAVFVLFTLGVASRVTSVLTWLLVVSFMANPAARFDADYLLGILAFYLMIGYLLLGQWHVFSPRWTANGDLSAPPTTSVAGRIFGSRAAWLLGSGVEAGTANPSYAANLAVRLLQVHFALIVVASGLHKLQFGGWWSGTAFWYALNGPFTTSESQLRTLRDIRAGYLIILSVAAYAALAWQIGFPLFAWRPGRMRVILLGGALLGWSACWDIYQLPLFGPVYLIGCLSYLTPGEWLALRGFPARILARSRVKPEGSA